MIRKYQTKEIPDRIIDKLLDNAHRAPSAGHTQVQEFIVVKNTETKKKLRRASVNQEQVEESAALLVVCSNTSRSVKRYGQRATEFYSVVDGAFASMLILLTATDEGLGACFVGAFNDREVSEILGLPPHVRPIGIISLGYPSGNSDILKRIPRDKLVHYERW